MISEDPAHPSALTRRPTRRTLLRIGVPAAVALAGGGAYTLSATSALAAGPSNSELNAELRERISNYLSSTGTQVEASVCVQRGTRKLYYNNNQIHDTASIVKLEILAMLLEKYSSPSAIPSTRKEQARRMITQSHNDSATALYNFLGGCDALAAAHVRYGMHHTHSSDDCRWGLTTTSAADQVRSISVNVFTGRLSSAKVKYARGLLGNVISSQDWGVKSAAKSGETVWLKNGWDNRQSLGGLWVVNSVGVLRVPGQKSIRMAILTSKAKNDTEGIPIVERIARITRSVVDRMVF